MSYFHNGALFHFFEFLTNLARYVIAPSVVIALQSYQIQYVYKCFTLCR